jgi:hypothetical protein
MTARETAMVMALASAGWQNHQSFWLPKHSVNRDITELGRLQLREHADREPYTGLGLRSQSDRDISATGVPAGKAQRGPLRDHPFG